MDLDALAFPALIIAEDGWVQLVSDRDAIETWTPSAISKYSRARVLFFDSADRAWRIDRIEAVPRQNSWRKALRKLTNRKLRVQITVSPVSDPLPAVQSALAAAIDLDDDLLTQFVDAHALKRALRTGSSFARLIAILRSKRAI